MRSPLAYLVNASLHAADGIKRLGRAIALRLRAAYHAGNMAEGELEPEPLPWSARLPSRLR